MLSAMIRTFVLPQGVRRKRRIAALLPERGFPDELRPKFRRRRHAPSPEKFDGLSFFAAGRSILSRDHERDNDETLPSFMGGSQTDR
jgi:hypothetical protein